MQEIYQWKVALGKDYNVSTITLLVFILAGLNGPKRDLTIGDLYLSTHST